MLLNFHSIQQDKEKKDYFAANKTGQTVMVYAIIARFSPPQF